MDCEYWIEDEECAFHYGHVYCMETPCKPNRDKNTSVTPTINKTEMGILIDELYKDEKYKLLWTLYSIKVDPKKISITSNNTYYPLEE